MGPILSPWPKLSGARMGYPYGPHVPAHMGPMWDMYGHVGWACNRRTINFYDDDDDDDDETAGWIRMPLTEWHFDPSSRMAIGDDWTQ